MRLWPGEAHDRFAGDPERVALRLASTSENVTDVAEGYISVTPDDQGRFVPTRRPALSALKIPMTAW